MFIRENSKDAVTLELDLGSSGWISRWGRGARGGGEHDCWRDAWVMPQCRGINGACWEIISLCGMVSCLDCPQDQYLCFHSGWKCWGQVFEGLRGYAIGINWMLWFKSRNIFTNEACHQTLIQKPDKSRSTWADIERCLLGLTLFFFPFFFKIFLEYGWFTMLY